MMKRYKEEIDNPEAQAWLKKNDKKEVLIMINTKKTFPLNCQATLVNRDDKIGLTMKNGGAVFTHRTMTNVKVHERALLFDYDGITVQLKGA
jgi:hypothetical protein